MDIGFVRDLPRLKASEQKRRLVEFGIDPRRINVVGEHYATALELAHTLREGENDRFCVLRAAVLAEPVKAGRGRPRETLREVIKVIKQKGATVYEVETNRECTDPDDMIDMVFDAINELSGAKRKKNRGRPKEFDPSKEDIAAAKIEWRSVEHRFNKDAVAAMPVVETKDGRKLKWTKRRAEIILGKSGRGG